MNVVGELQRAALGHSARLGRQRRGRGHGSYGRCRAVELQLALGIAHHAFHDVDQPLAAGVDHTRLAQNGQQVGRALQRLLAALQDALQHEAQVVALARGVGRLGRALADDGQDRALDRAHDPLIGRVGRALESGGQVDGAERLLTGQLGGQAAPDLTEDDARIAARAHQRPLRHLSGEAADVGLLAVLHAGIGRAHGQQHVGAGVAVGHGEHVQRVHVVAVLF